jgi:hypothetical protein
LFGVPAFSYRLLPAPPVATRLLAILAVTPTPLFISTTDTAFLTLSIFFSFSFANTYLTPAPATRLLLFCTIDNMISALLPCSAFCLLPFAFSSFA